MLTQVLWVKIKSLFLESKQVNGTAVIEFDFTYFVNNLKVTWSTIFVHPVKPFSSFTFNPWQLHRIIYRLRFYDAWRAADMNTVAYWNDWLLACRESRELRLEDVQLGQALQRLLVCRSMVWRQSACLRQFICSGRESLAG